MNTEQIARDVLARLEAAWTSRAICSVFMVFLFH